LLLQHEKSSDIAHPKGQTAVCSLYGSRCCLLSVSTRQQHRSGLGIEAQRAAVERFAQAENIRIIVEFVEAKPAKGPTRWIAGRSLPTR
jgi:hypothetical protein